MGDTSTQAYGTTFPLGGPPPVIPFAGDWSPLRRAGCCPNCGAWVKKKPADGKGKEGTVKPIIGATREWHLFCPHCEEWFKATFFDPTMQTAAPKSGRVVS